MMSVSEKAVDFKRFEQKGKNNGAARPYSARYAFKCFSKHASRDVTSLTRFLS